MLTLQVYSNFFICAERSITYVAALILDPIMNSFHMAYQFISSFEDFVTFHTYNLPQFIMHPYNV